MALPSSKGSIATGSPLGEPNTARPQNPNSRSSEITNPMRRSFSGTPFTKPSITPKPRGYNPVTPVNSPSEFPRRRENISCPQENEEKENGKDSNSNMRRAHSRSPSISKGAKNFMSPTISAVSKFNASPRKKILSERNSDLIHSSSTSLSDLRSSCGLINISENCEETDTKTTVEASHDSTITDMEAATEVSSRSSKGSRKRVAFDSVVQEIPPIEISDVETEDDLVNVDEEFGDPKSPSSSLLAPLDADPFVPLPPYDPKTNYLSPRPQFLHYRPSPRIEHLVGKGGNLNFNILEDGIDLDGLSDTDVTTEETSPSEKESDDASSNEITIEESVSERKADGQNISEEEAVETEEAVGEEKLPKQSFFKRRIFVASIFIALVACSTMIGTHYSLEGSYLTIKGASFPEEARQLRDNIAESMRLWYANSLSYLSAVVSEFRGNEYEGYVLKFYNLTDLNENPWSQRNNIVGSSIQVDGFENLEIGVEEGKQIEYSETEEEVVAEYAADEEAEASEDEPKEKEEEEKEIMKPLNTEPELESEISDTEVEVKTDMEDKVDKMEFAVDIRLNQPELSGFGSESQLEEIPKVEASNQPELPKAGVETGVYIVEEEQGSIYLVDDNAAASYAISESSEIVNSSAVIALLGVLVALVSAVAYSVYVKKRTVATDVPPLRGIQKQQPLVAKKFDISPAAANQTAETDVIGVDSYPSEISSFQKTAAYVRSSEVKTHAVKSLRRESTASSFSDLSLDSSPSYGSFTTYEMIPSKHRNGDDELVITPIRRSSRLRKQVTSP